MMRDLDNDRVLPADETPAIIHAKLKRFRQVLQSEGIEVVRNDDRFLLAFLRARKFEIFRAAALAASFMNVFVEDVEELRKCRMEHVKPFALQEVSNTLLERAHDGSVVNVIMMSNISADTYHPKDHISLNWYKVLANFDAEDIQKHGVTIVENASGMSLAGAMKLRKVVGSKEQKKVFKLIQTVAPLQVKGIYVVNQPWYLSVLFAIVKPFMKKKIRNRVHFLGKPYKLQQFIPASTLPPFLGGTAQTTIHDWVRVRESMEVNGWHPFFARIPLDSPYRKKIGIPDDVYIAPEEDTILTVHDALQGVKRKHVIKRRIVRRRKRHLGADESGGGGGKGGIKCSDGGSNGARERPDDVGFEKLSVEADVAAY